MSYYVYLIGSFTKFKLRTYVGYAKDLKKRLFKHNAGKGAKSTKGRKWKVIYKKKCASKNSAMSLEYYIKKNKKLRKFFANKI